MALWLWKHWFWITKVTMARWPICVLLVAQLMAIATDAAPVGAVDTKSIMFKKFALNDDGKGSGLGDKPNLPVVAAASMSGNVRKAMRISLGSGNINESIEDAVGDVMDGHEEISRIFVTLPTTSSTTILSTTTSSNSSIVAETDEVEGRTKSLIPSENEKTNISSTEEEPEPLIKATLTRQIENESEIVELSSIHPRQDASKPTGEEDSTPAKLIQVSITATNSQPTELGTPEGDNSESGLPVSAIPSMSIEDSDKKIDNENIQNLILQEEDTDAMDLNNSNRSRKSKGLIDNQTNKNLLTRSTGDEALDVSNPAAQLQPAEAQNLNRSPNLLIQFSDSDKLELLNSQIHALTSDDGSSRTRSSNFGLISGISFSVLALFCTVSLIGAMMYRRRYVNKPQTLSEPDSSAYIDDSIIRDNSDEMYSLDNDSFLNSLEAMTIQNYWTDHVKHTKL